MITFKGRQIPETLGEIVDPRHTTLIIHELLNDFCAEGGAFDKAARRIDASKILPPIVKLLETARKKSIKILYVRYTNYADGSSLNDPQVSRRYEELMAPSYEPAPVPETWGWENLPEVAPQEGEPILPKLRVDCFFQTNLDTLLRSSGIKTFVIVGIGAERGILPTVGHGQNLGYFAVAPEDCLAATDPAKIDVAKRFIGRSALMPMSAEVLEAWGA